jgi:hypothetical protein
VAHILDALDHLTLGDTNPPTSNSPFRGQSVSGNHQSRRVAWADMFALVGWFAIWLVMVLVILRHERRAAVSAS